MRSFQSVTAPEFASLVQTFPWTRRISEVHLHHTWRPRQRDYSGRATIEGMWRHHTRVNGWSDIAQHVSVAPDGTIWLGRNFNWAPASAAGFNGNRQAGPFMIEMIGDFDVGHEALTAEQRASTLTVIKSVQQRFGLSAEQLRFHSEMSAKTCPGSTQDKAVWIGDIGQFVLPADSKARAAFGTRGDRSFELIASMNPTAEQTDDMAHAEHEADLSSMMQTGQRGEGWGEAADSLDPRMLEELSDHIVNLSQGRFSTDGIVQSSETDVDRIINERLSKMIRNTGDEVVRLMVYAHGGLVEERPALLGAFEQLDFWRKNNVYPLFFIWETGFADTFRQVLRGALGLEVSARGLGRDITDRMVENAVRILGAGKIWGGMKRSAEQAAAPGGGAAYVGKMLGPVLERYGDRLELHLVGHSAGSIFQSHFLSTLGDQVKVKSAHFLAPAITCEAFLEQFAPELGAKVEHLTLYTMTKTRELADTVTKLYGKSLLYMIHHALEPERETPILGLEESLRREPALRDMFGLGGQQSKVGEVIWSPSADSGSGSASQSVTHGGFDNDPATMQSICRRVLGKVNNEPLHPFAKSRALERSLWEGEPEWPDHLKPFLLAPAQPETALLASGSVGPAPSLAPLASLGRRRALCIGIDNYPHITPLGGCLKDADRWRSALETAGFEVTTVDEKDATAEVIVARLRNLIQSADAGDRLVFQFAGHGTLIRDSSDDEIESQSDSCLCAIDCNNPQGNGGLVIDDEIYEAYRLLRHDAHLTCFFDCCHSGTAIRAYGAPPQRQVRPGMKARAVKPTANMIEAYRAKKGRFARATGGGPIGVLFAACQDSEFAYEYEGAGLFTAVATKELPKARGLSNRQFHQKILTALGPDAGQSPRLYGDVSRFDHPLALF